MCVKLDAGSSEEVDRGDTQGRPSTHTDTHVYLSFAQRNMSSRRKAAVAPCAGVKAWLRFV